MDFHVESEISGGPLSRGALGMLCEAIGGAWSSHALDVARELHIGWKVVRGLEQRPKKAVEGSIFGFQNKGKRKGVE